MSMPERWTCFRNGHQVAGPRACNANQSAGRDFCKGCPGPRFQPFSNAKQGARNPTKTSARPDAAEPVNKKAVLPPSAGSAAPGNPSDANQGDTLVKPTAPAPSPHKTGAGAVQGQNKSQKPDNPKGGTPPVTAHQAGPPAATDAPAAAPAPVPPPLRGAGAGEGPLRCLECGVELAGDWKDHRKVGGGFVMVTVEYFSKGYGRYLDIKYPICGDEACVRAAFDLFLDMADEAKDVMGQMPDQTLDPEVRNA